MEVQLPNVERPAQLLELTDCAEFLSFKNPKGDMRKSRKCKFLALNPELNPEPLNPTQPSTLLNPELVPEP